MTTLDALLLCDDEKAIQHSEPRSWARARKDEDRLIGVCQEYLLVIALRPWIQANNRAFAFLHLFDHPAAVRQNGDADAVSDRGDVACSASFFQLTS